MEWRSLFSALHIGDIFDAIIPPRKTEEVVRNLSLERLSHIAATVRQPSDADFSYLLPYRNPEVRALVWEMKYRKNGRAAALAAALLADEVLGIASEELSSPLLIPVPMHAERRRERGYNQTELLCEAISTLCGDSLAYVPQALSRVRHTPPQQGLPRAKRLKNIRDSMEADEYLMRGRACIVVDDVTTTGATLSEAGRALRAAGASAVHCLALAG